MNKTTKIVLAIVAFVVAIAVLMGTIALMIGIYIWTRPETQQGEKTITVVVVHSDGTEKTFVYHTDEEYLATVLQAEGLIEGYEDQYGFVMEKVDGEAAVWETDSAYWSLYIGQEYATSGVSTTPVYDGSVFKLVYESWG